MPIPCVIVSGFLGGGKTTLLRRLLQHAGTLGRRPLLVINEAGAIDIDGQLLAANGAEQVSLLGGCLCCAKHEELANVLTELLAHDRGDLLLIECSGMASPREVLASTAPFVAQQRLSPPVVVTVVDAARLQRQRMVVDLVKEQLAAAEVILLNKQDLVLAENRGTLEQLVATSAAPHVLRYWTEQSRLPAAQMAALFTEPGNDPVLTAAHSPHHHHLEESLTLCLPAPVSLDCLRRLLAGLPVDLDRLKGFVFTSDARWQLVQYAYGETEFTPWDGPLPNEYSTLVCLGAPALLSETQTYFQAMITTGS